MKILHVITSLQTGGAEKLMVDLLPRLKQMGHEVELCVFDGTKTPFYEQLEATGVPIHPLSIGESVYNPKHIIRVCRLMKDFDIVHTHNTACQLFVAFSNLFIRKSIVTTEHSTSNRRRRYPIFRWVDSWLYHQYDMIVTVSDISGKNIIDYVGDYSLPIKSIPNGIDVNQFRYAEPCQEITEVYKDCYVSIMVAAFRYEKDQITVIKAFNLLPQKYHLFFVGDGEKRCECEALSQALGLNGRIHFLGIRSDVPNLLHTADVVIMSSHREGLSLSNLEGMASGTPFIASDVDGLHEIVDGYGILFPHEDEHTLAASITKVCEDNQYAKKIADQCQRRAAQFDISKMAERYNQVYMQLKQ